MSTGRRRPADWKFADWRPALLIAAVPVVLAGIPYLGFDLAIFFSVIAGLWLFGERRVMFSLSLALGIAAALSIVALTLLTFPTSSAIARSLWSGL